MDNLIGTLVISRKITHYSGNLKYKVKTWKQRSTALFSRVLEVSASYTNRAGQTENFSSMSSNAETLYCQFLPANFQERANVLPSSAVLSQSFSGCFAHNLMKENTLQVFRWQTLKAAFNDVKICNPWRAFSKSKVDMTKALSSFSYCCICIYNL